MGMFFKKIWDWVNTTPLATEIVGGIIAAIVVAVLTAKNPSIIKFIRIFLHRFWLALRKGWANRLVVILLVMCLLVSAATIWKIKTSPSKAIIEEREPTPFIPPDKTIIDVAAIDGPGPDPDKYAFEEILFEHLHRATQKYPDVEIRPLGKSIPAEEGSGFFFEIGRERGAAMIIQQRYNESLQAVRIHIYFGEIKKSRVEILRTHEKTEVIPLEKLGKFDAQERLAEEIAIVVLAKLGLFKYEEGDYRSAIRFFDHVFSHEIIPNEIIDLAEIYYSRGDAYLHQGDSLSAYQEFTEALRSNPNHLAAKQSLNYILEFQPELAKSSLSDEPNKSVDIPGRVPPVNVPPDRDTRTDMFDLENREELTKNPTEMPDTANENANPLDIDDPAGIVQSYPSKSSIDEIAEQGLQYLKSAKFDSAIACYDQVIALDSAQVNAYFNRGYAHAKKRAYDLAIVDFGKAISRNPSLAEAYNNLGYIHFDKRELSEAIFCFIKAIEIRSDYKNARRGIINTYRTRANHYREKGLYAEAENDLGLAAFFKGNSSEAIDHFGNAIKRKPDFEEAYYNRGLAFLSQKEYTDAIKSFTELLKLNPKHENALFKRGDSYMEKKDFDRAISDYRQYIRLVRNNPAAYNALAEAYLLTGNYVAALRYTNRAIKLDSQYFEAYKNRALAYDGMKDFQGARKNYEFILDNAEKESETYKYAEKMLRQYRSKGHMSNE